MNINNSAYAPKYGNTFKDVKFFEYFLIGTLRIINTIKKLATFSTRPTRLYGTAKVHKFQYPQDITRENIPFRTIKLVYLLTMLLRDFKSFETFMTKWVYN